MWPCLLVLYLESLIVGRVFFWWAKMGRPLLPSPKNRGCMMSITFKFWVSSVKLWIFAVLCRTLILVTNHKNRWNGFKITGLRFLIGWETFQILTELKTAGYICKKWWQNGKYQSWNILCKEMLIDYFRKLGD